MFFEVLNTPMAVLAVLFVVVAANAFLYFGYYSPRTTTSPPDGGLPAQRTGPSTTPQRPDPVERTKEPRPTNYSREHNPHRRSRYRNRHSDRYLLSPSARL